MVALRGVSSFLALSFCLTVDCGRYHPIGGGSSGGEPSRALQTDHGLLLSADWHGVVILHDVGTLDGGTEAVVRSMDPSRMQGHTDDIIALALFAPEV